MKFIYQKGSISFIYLPAQKKNKDGHQRALVLSFQELCQVIA